MNTSFHPDLRSSARFIPRFSWSPTLVRAINFMSRLRGVPKPPQPEGVTVEDILLPGGAGVTLDYEIFNPATPDRIRGHVEHTILARTHDGGAVMVIGHDHAQSVAILRETEPGSFELGAESSPFPMKVVVSMPEPGRLRHSWWYGAPGQEATERDVAVLVRTT